MKTILLSAVLIAAATSRMSAQSIGNYAFSTNTTGTFTDMAAGTQLIGSNVNNVSSAVTSIGFDFYFVGQHYSQFSVNTNGVLRFGPIAIATGANACNLDGQARIAVFAGAVSSEALGTSPTGRIRYLVSGSIPNRVLTIEWENMRIPDGSTAASNYSSFQLRLYESGPGSPLPGRIEMLYGRMRYGQFTIIGTYEYRIGIGHDDEVTAYQGIDGNALTSTLGKNPTNTTALIVLGSPIPNLDAPTEGSRRMFIYSNAANAPATVPLGFTSACTSSSSITLKWKGVITNESSYVIYRSTDNVQYNFLTQVSSSQNSYTDTGLASGTTYYYRLYLLTEGLLSNATVQLSATTLTAGGPVYPVRKGNWTDASVWSSNTLPTATTDIALGCGGAFNVLVDGSAMVRNLTLDAEALLTVQAGQRLNVMGNLVNGGTINNQANGEIVVNGNVNNLANSYFVHGTTSAASLSMKGSGPQNLSHSGKAVAQEGVYSQTGSSAIADNVSVAINNVVPTAATLAACGSCGKLTVAVPANTNNRVRAVMVNIQHPNNDDLDIYLVAPNSTVMLLATDVGGTSNHFSNVIFSDATAAVLPDEDAAIAADNTYRIEVGTLSSYAGPMNGNWTLYVADDQAGNAGGILTGFTLTLWEDLAASEFMIRQLIIDNTSTTGVTLLSPVRVLSQLTLTDGILYTSATNSLTLENNAASTSGNAGSFVDGPMTKKGNAPDPFTYPLGDGAVWARLTTDYIDITATTSTAFTAEYFDAAFPDLSNDATLHSASYREYWILNRTGVPPTQSKVQLYWQSGSRSGINDVATTDLVVAKYNGADWINVGRSAISGTAATGNVTSADVTSFSPFAFGSVGAPTNPLPIKLQYFSATLDQDLVVLKWKTTEEKDNDFFTIERTTDGESFEEVAVVGSKGNGTAHEYIVKRSAIAGRSYYRLKQTDFDGKAEFFGMEKIDYDATEAASLRAYPSPRNGEAMSVKIQGMPKNTRIPLYVYTIQGSVVFQKQLMTSASGAVDTDVVFDKTLVSGLYVIKAGPLLSMTQKYVVR